MNKEHIDKRVLRFTCYECRHCGFCCRVWDIDLSKGDIRKIVSLGYDLKSFLDTKPVVKAKMVGKEKNCVFLDKDTMCILEKRHGQVAKPYTCRKYPDYEVADATDDDRDYYFYEYAKKVISRDLLIKILDKIKNSGKDELFDRLLEELERLRNHKDPYIDIFNYSEAKTSILGKYLTRKFVSKLAKKKFKEDDIKMLASIPSKKKVETEKLVEHIQKKIPTNQALNTNFPLMLLTFLYFLKSKEWKDPEKLADFFIEWNNKRF
ncbi:MAG: YkgJ family cysteine cluster protein [Candidatus Aenigmarchaeota archaeon]|nr:YkgJ family cysteine cluster protein [Candidatus Aenigmarchaeota archaeon]